MGVRATITEITPQAFDEMMADGNPDISGSKSYSLDKAWSEIHKMLQPAGYPLCQDIVGDALFPSSQHSYDDFNNGAHDYYAGLVTIELVKRIANVLEGIQMPDLPASSEISQWNESDKHKYIEYLGSCFRSLQDAYREASRHGNALMVVIA